MNHQSRFENALSSSNPGQALRSLALELGSEGNNRQQVYDIFGEYLLAYREKKDFRENDEELILDTMDALSGWCHKDAQLLVDK